MNRNMVYDDDYGADDDDVDEDDDKLFSRCFL